MRFSFLDRVLALQEPVADSAPHCASRLYRLDSALPGARFTASIEAWWHPSGSASEEIVFQHLRLKSNAVTSRGSVLDAAEVNDKVNVSLAGRRVIPQSGVRLIDARAVLDVAKDDLDYAEQRAGIERRASIEAAGLEARYAHLLRLRDLFLSDSAMARLWWSTGDPDRLLQLADNKAKFDTIVSVVARSPDDLAPSDKIAPLIARFLASLGPDHREYLISQLAKIFENYRQPSLAEELRAID